MTLGRVTACIATVLAIGGLGERVYTNPVALGFAIVPAGAATPRVESSSLTRSDQVNFRSFHDHLAPFGTWINHARWGAVWRPNAGRGFRPYRDGGHWEDTEDYGTVWVSDYPWGDVPFHYGRWVYDPRDGWIWVPGYVWGPGWVVWRAGVGNIGWLPMPPWIAYDGYGDFPDDWSDGYGYADDGFSEDAFDDLWCFVSADDLYAPSISYYAIGTRYYRGFIGRTVGWTRFSIFHGHVFNRSIDRGRFRTTFGHDLREGSRHDFEGRIGPVVDYATGRQIQIHEHGMAHFTPPTQTVSHTYFGAIGNATVRSEHSVNVYRGGSSAPAVTRHTYVPAHVYRSAPAYRATPYLRSPPPYHSVPHVQLASPAPSHGSPPPHSAPSR